MGQVTGLPPVLIRRFVTVLACCFFGWLPACGVEDPAQGIGELSTTRVPGALTGTEQLQADSFPCNNLTGNWCNADAGEGRDVDVGVVFVEGENWGEWSLADKNAFLSLLDAALTWWSYGGRTDPASCRGFGLADDCTSTLPASKYPDTVLEAPDLDATRKWITDAIDKVDAGCCNNVPSGTASQKVSQFNENCVKLNPANQAVTLFVLKEAGNEKYLVANEERALVFQGGTCGIVTNLDSVEADDEDGIRQVILAHVMGHLAGAVEESWGQPQGCPCDDPFYPCGPGQQPPVCQLNPPVACVGESSGSIMSGTELPIQLSSASLSGLSRCQAGWKEYCGGADEDCDGLFVEDNAVDCGDYYRDCDGDGYGWMGTGNPTCGSQSVPVSRCLCAPEEPEYTLYVNSGNGGDCHDDDPAIHPGASDVCDDQDFDENCNGVTDGQNTPGCTFYFQDKDGDGYGNPAISKCLCSAEGYFTTTDMNDCNDSSNEINPGGIDDCDLGIDKNCDKEFKDCTCQYGDIHPCDLGYPPGTVPLYTCQGQKTCNNNGNFGPCIAKYDEDCTDGIDNNCDGLSDADVCGECEAGKTKPCEAGACQGELVCIAGGFLESECKPLDTVNVLPEQCDGQDNDCDPSTNDFDEDTAIFGQKSCCVCEGTACRWKEVPNCENHDGLGVLKTSCYSSSKYYQSTTECNKDGGSVMVGTSKVYHGDGKDNDCDATTDEGCLCQCTAVCSCSGEGDEFACTVGSCSVPSRNCSKNAGDGNEDCQQGTQSCTNCSCPSKSSCSSNGQKLTGWGKWSSCENDEGSPDKPRRETCDGKDNDCDGLTDELGTILCGIGECRIEIPYCIGGMSQSCDNYAFVKATSEVCDGKDNDCDGSTDEECDKDSDGYCTTSMICTGLSVGCPMGCNDCRDDPETDQGDVKAGSIHPGMPESPNAVDDNCNGQVDEGYKDTDGDGWVDDYDDDDDNDGLYDDQDNCQKTYNPIQTNTDKDEYGDACDPDDDGDGVLDDGDLSGSDSDLLCGSGETIGCDDNCRLTQNGVSMYLNQWSSIQSDVDSDGIGDACDADMDNDEVSNGSDNCPRWANPEQADHDKDTKEGLVNRFYHGQIPDPGEPAQLSGGDACDLDDDNDGILDDGDDGIPGNNPCESSDWPEGGPTQPLECDDNCPFTANADPKTAGGLLQGLDTWLAHQSDTDSDGMGDACDSDMDGDGVPNGEDNCPRWPNVGQDDNDAQTDKLRLGATGYTVGEEHHWNFLHPLQTVVNPTLTLKKRMNGGGDACDRDDDNDGIADAFLDDSGEPSGVSCGTWTLLQCGHDDDLTVANPDLSYDNHPCGQWKLDGCDDNCPLAINGSPKGDVDNYTYAREAYQADHDGDGLGDACDPDDDGDGVLDNGDPSIEGVDGSDVANSSLLWKPARVRFPDCVTGEVIPQGDLAGRQCTDGIKSTCDDNCPFIKNPEQADTDGDGNPEDDMWDWESLYAGDEPCDHDDDDDGLLDVDEVRCGTDPKVWDTDGDGFSDYIELMPAGWLDAPEGVEQFLRTYCCGSGEGQKCLVGDKPHGVMVYRLCGSVDGSTSEDDREQCLFEVGLALDREAGAAENGGRNCTKPDGEAGRWFATDPLWDKDSPDHHIAPLDDLSGGGGLCRVGGGSRARGSLVPVALLLFATVVFLIGVRRGRGRFPGSGAAFLVTSLLIPITASALDLQVIRPVAMGRGGFYTQTTDTLWKMDAGAQLIYSFLYKPVVIRTASEGYPDIDVVKYGQLMEFQGALGLWNGIELDVHLPIHLDRTVDKAFSSELGGTSVGDLYVGIKYQALRRARYGVGLSVTPFLVFGTGSESKMAGTGNQNFGVSVALDKQFSIVTLAVNIGVTRRLDSGFLSDHFDRTLRSSFDWGALVSVCALKEGLHFFVEASGLVELKKGPANMVQVVAGMRAPLGILDLSVGYAKGFTKALAMPEHMAFIGLGFYRWPDADERFQ